MTTKEFAPIERSLLTCLPGFTMRRWLLYQEPLRPVLRGIAFEASGFAKRRFFVWTFLMPLCVPISHVWFTFGRRLRHPETGDSWDADRPDTLSALREAATTEALPFLQPVQNLSQFADVAATFSLNLNVAQATAYALTGAGRVAEAMTVFERMERARVTRDWERAIVKQSTLLRELLVSSLADARLQRQRWEDETVCNLALE